MPQIQQKSIPLFFSGGLSKNDFNFMMPASSMFWPFDGILESNFSENQTLGFFDEGGISEINQAYKHLSILSFYCNLTICEFNSNINKNSNETHARKVMGVALKFLPGPANIEYYNSRGVLELERALLQIEKRLQELEKKYENYSYILNVSKTIISTKHREHDARVYELIKKLHKEYPRFQMIVAAGNSAVDTPTFFTKIPEPIVVGAHGRNFRQTTFSNFGPDVTTSTLGVDVKTIFELCIGNSCSSPIIAAMANIIMHIVPDLKNFELKKIIQQLSVPANEFITSHAIKYSFKLKTKVFIFDLRKFAEILNNEYKGRVNPVLLAKISKKAATYFIDNLPFSDVKYVIPNYNDKISFNINDIVKFTVRLENSLPWEMQIHLTLSSVRVPSYLGVNDLITRFKDYNPEGVLIANQHSISISPYAAGDLEIEFQRLNASGILLRRQFTNLSGTSEIISYNGVGNIDNVMVGLAAEPGIKIFDIKPLESKSIQNVNDNYYNDMQPPDINLNSELLTKSAISAFGLCFLFVARYVKNKMKYNKNEQEFNKKSRLTI